jgi:hypothetical protein
LHAISAQVCAIHICKRVQVKKMGMHTCFKSFQTAQWRPIFFFAKKCRPASEMHSDIYLNFILFSFTQTVRSEKLIFFESF